MGKRQIGQLEISDLVSTLLLSELAALPIENRDIPIVYAIVPTVVLMTLEIVSSALQGRLPSLKNIFSPRPGVLVKMGVPDFAELERSRISSDELMVSLRKSGCSDISEVAYAILEQDGSVSVIPRAGSRGLTPSDIGLEKTEGGIFRIVVDRGVINFDSLSRLSKNNDWLSSLLESRGVELCDIELLLVDESDSIRLFCKCAKETADSETSQKKRRKNEN